MRHTLILVALLLCIGCGTLPEQPPPPVVVEPAPVPDPDPVLPSWPILTPVEQPWGLYPYKTVGMLAVRGQGLFATCSNVYKNGFKSCIFRNGAKVYEGGQETIGQPSLVGATVYFPVEHGSHVLYWDVASSSIRQGHATHGKWSVALGEGLVAYNSKFGPGAVFGDKAKVYDVLTDAMVWEPGSYGMPRKIIKMNDRLWTVTNFGQNRLCSDESPTSSWETRMLHIELYHGKLYGGGGVDTGPAFGKDGRVYRADRHGYEMTQAVLFDTGSTSCQQIIKWRGYLVFLFTQPDLVLLMDSKEQFQMLHAWPAEANPDGRDFGICAADWNGDLWVARTDGGTARIYRME